MKASLCGLTALLLATPGAGTERRDFHAQRTKSKTIHARSSVTLVAVGDILFAGAMGRLMKTKGMDYPFAKMRKILRNADVTFGNLECCASKQGAPLDKKFTFRADPALVPALSRNGFKVVSLANNHTWDYGRDALRDTVDSVRSSGVLPVGAGANRAEAHRLVIIEKRGLKIGFLAYLGLLPPLVRESDTQPSVSIGSEERIADEVSKAKRRVNFLFVSLHAGEENAQKITARQKSFAHAAINAGADCVIGHHPHVVQSEEHYHGKPIFYSLGNFAFSTTGRGSGSILTATLFANGKLLAKQTRLDLSGGQPHLRRGVRNPDSRNF